MDRKRLTDFKTKVEEEVQNNILDFWVRNSPDKENGGFYGEIENDLTIKKEADKSLVLNSRILWTFSAVYRKYGEDKFLDLARRAYNYLLDYFWDDEFSGFYWLLDYQGQPVNRKKQIYGQAFCIYAFAEYYKASGDEKSLERAKEVFKLIEEYSYDLEHKGYIEACTREWEISDALQLSEKDMNEKKSMNTHLHILEAYTNLFRVWPDDRLKESLTELIEVIIRYIINSDYHFDLFFNQRWNCKSEIVSYGHDIEGSWLLHESAEVLGKEAILTVVKELAVKMAEVTLKKAVDKDGGVFHEGTREEVLDSDKHWWPQAEAVVGFLNAYLISKDDKFLEAAWKVWGFIEENIVDKEYGEWFSKVDKAGCPGGTKGKVSAWKSCYHNTRACLETIKRLEEIKIDLSLERR